MKRHDKTIVPRNPLVMLAKQRKSGVHNKLNKIVKRDFKKLELRNE